MESFDKYLKEIGEVGYITTINQSLVYVDGLPEVRPNELVITEKGHRGIVQNILPNSVEVMMFEAEDLEFNLKVARTNQPLLFPASEALLGRVVNPLGIAIDGAGSIRGEATWQPIESEAPGISQRVIISQPAETGVFVIDQLVSLGKGQRELVLGDQKTGKTTFCLQALANQTKDGVIGIYVSSGKKNSDIRYVTDYLKRMGVLDKVIIVAASSANPPTLIYLAPFAGMSLAEYFKEKGRDVFLVLDDLSLHAKYYREIALLSQKVPGRGSYPADIFHLHGRLLERAGNIKLNNNSHVSITVLPIAETLEGEITGYIQTNLMAITDGHIYFDSDEVKKGKQPAVNALKSVSRVGFQTRKEIEKQITQELKRRIVSYSNAQQIARFGVEFVEQLKLEIDFGQKLEALMSQNQYSIIPNKIQIFLVCLLFSGFWQDKDIEQVQQDRDNTVAVFNRGGLSSLLDEFNQSKNLQDAISYTSKISAEVSKKIHGLI